MRQDAVILGRSEAEARGHGGRLGATWLRRQGPLVFVSRFTRPGMTPAEVRTKLT